LIDAGADVNILPLITKHSPMHAAASIDDVIAWRTLLRAGGDMHIHLTEVNVEHLLITA
jgi:hypothetical protein